MDIDLGLELVAGPLAAASRRACIGPHRRLQAGAAAIAVRFGIAARRSPWRDGSPQKAISPPARSTRWNSANARRRSGMWWRTAWPKTRSKLVVGEGQLLGVGAGRARLEPEPGGAVAQCREHARGDVGGREPVEQAALEQVEPEVPGARADLERVAQRLRGPGAERLRHLRPHLALAERPEVDPPLGVVVGGRRVVIAGVGVLDLLGGRRRGGGHRGRLSRKPQTTSCWRRPTPPPS